VKGIAPSRQRESKILTNYHGSLWNSSYFHSWNCWKNVHPVSYTLLFMFKSPSCLLQCYYFVVSILKWVVTNYVQSFSFLFLSFSINWLLLFTSTRSVEIRYITFYFQFNIPSFWNEFFSHSLFTVSRNSFLLPLYLLMSWHLVN